MRKCLYLLGNARWWGNVYIYNLGVTQIRSEVLAWHRRKPEMQNWIFCKLCQQTFDKFLKADFCTWSCWSFVITGAKHIVDVSIKALLACSVRSSLYFDALFWNFNHSSTTVLQSESWQHQKSSLRQWKRKSRFYALNRYKIINAIQANSGKAKEWTGIPDSWSFSGKVTFWVDVLKLQN